MMVDPKKFIRVTLITLMILGISGYAYFRSKDAIRGITITSSIEDGASLDSTLLTLTGNAPHTSRFTINGKELILDKNGNFTDTLLLQDGYNILTLEAGDKFGRTIQKVIRLYAKPAII
jgi:Zn/Cd-binding protein ZinT